VQRWIKKLTRFKHHKMGRLSKGAVHNRQKLKGKK